MLDHADVQWIVLGMWLAWALYWFVNAFGNKRSVYTQSWGSRLSYIAFGFASAFLIVHVDATHVQIFRENLATQLAGIAACVAGFAITIWARIILGGNWSGLITLKENHELVRSGPYRFARHPIYSGVILAVIGTELALNPTLSGPLLVVLMAAALKVKSLGEEKVLKQQFPESYPEYQRQVKPLVPFVC